MATRYAVDIEEFHACLIAANREGLLWMTTCKPQGELQPRAAEPELQSGFYRTLYDNILAQSEAIAELFRNTRMSAQEPMLHDSLHQLASSSFPIGIRSPFLQLRHRRRFEQ